MKSRFLAWLGMTMETLGQPATLLVKKVRKRCEVYLRMGTPALLSLVFLCVLCASVVSPASAQTTITGTVKDASGTALTSGTIIFTLSQEGTVSDPALLVVQPVVTCTITNGVIGTCSLRGNDEISPAGTFYRVRIISTGGRTFLPERRYTITGATWDIGTATPLASDTIAAQAYQIVQDEGTNLTQRQKLNFTGAGVSVSDDSGNAVTKVTITGGGGGGATHKIDSVDLTSQDPINFLDTAEFDWTNPAAGNLSLAIKAASVADSKLTSSYSGVGTCTNQFVRAAVDNAAPTCESIADADLPSTNALDTELHAQSHVLDGADHTVSGLTAGNVIRALTASTFGFAAILDGDLPASIARDSELHAQSHVLAGSDHTASGLTIGNVVRATGATTFDWQQLGFSDLGGSATAGQVPNLESLNGTLDVSSGGTGAAPSADDQVLTSSSTSAAVWKVIPDCNTNNMLTYTQSTNTWGCDADDGAGGGAPIGVQYVVGAADATLTAEKILTDGIGIDTVLSGGDAGAATINLNYADTLAGNPTFAAKECVFTIEGTSGGGFLCEGNVGGNTNEQLYLFPALDGVDTTTFIALGASDGDALAGDSATGFFDAGTLEDARLSANVALSSDNLGFFASTTSLQLSGLLSDETGTGLAVFGTSPTIVTPTIAATDWTNANHAHAAANSGGQVAHSDLSGIVATDHHADSILETELDTFAELQTQIADDTVLSDGNTATLTNKTLDVEATGNALTTVSYIEFPAATCIAATATLNWDDSPTLTEPAAACIAGTNITYGVADFDDTSDEGMQFSFILPTGWTGNIDFDFYWHGTAIVNEVVWALETVCVATGETFDPSFNTAQTVTDTAAGTANQRNLATISNVTTTGCAAGERMFLELSRDANNAADDFVGDARLVSTRLTLRRTQ